MTKAALDLKLIDAKFESRRSGPRLDAFDELLSTMPIGKAFDIPCEKNAKGKITPIKGFNVKAANLIYAPKVFKKRRLRVNGADVLRVFRDA